MKIENKNSREKWFTLRANPPKENYTKISNHFIDEIMPYINGNEIKIILKFMRSKDGFKFTKPWLAKYLGTTRSNLSNLLKTMVEKKLLFNYKDSYEVNLYLHTDDLENMKKIKSQNRKNGRANKIIKQSKPSVTIKKGVLKTSPAPIEMVANVSSNETVLKNNTPNVLNINTPNPTVKNETVLNSNTATVLNNNTDKNFYNSQLERGTDTFSSPNKTIDNNTNVAGGEMENANLENKEISLISNEGNSLRFLTKYPQFNESYKSNLKGCWERVDISNYNDAYIAHIVIEKKINNNLIETIDKHTYNLCSFMCSVCLKKSIPTNNLENQIKSQLTQGGGIR